MPVIKSELAPSFDLPGLHVTGPWPSRGCRETSVWRLAIAPNTEGTLHSVDREEIFVVLSGRATAELAGESIPSRPVTRWVVPPNVPFALANPHAEPFEAIAALPVGGRAAMPGGQPFAPPWTT